MSAYKDTREVAATAYVPGMVDTTKPTTMYVSMRPREGGRKVTEAEFAAFMQGRKVVTSWITIVDPPCMEYHDPDGRWLGAEVLNYYPEDPHEFYVNAALYPPLSTGPSE